MVESQNDRVGVHKSEAESHINPLVLRKCAVAAHLNPPVYRKRKSTEHKSTAVT